MKSGLSQFDKKTEIEFCFMCGAIRGDSWQTHPMRACQLRLRPRYGDVTQWILCDECDEGLRYYEGLQNTAPPKPDRLHLLGQIRRATIPDQEAVLSWLLQKFNLEAKKKK